MQKDIFIKYLNTYLKTTDFKDDSKNGLQVDTDKKEIKKIGYAVDATGYIFDKAIKEKVDMVIVHHGMFRGCEGVIVGNMYNKIKKLIKNDIGLYASHLPLDAHPKIGNNAILLEEFVKHFKIKSYKHKAVAEYHGQNIGFGITFKKKVTFADLKKFCKAIKIEENIYKFGAKKEIQSVFFASGGALSCATEAHQKDYDLLITGEGVHHEYIHAKELGQSVLVGGHYETEVFGVEALAQHLQKKHKIKTVFLDEKY